MLYVIPKVILTVISSTIVAFGFARFEVPFKKFWFATLIATILLSQSVLLIPRYLMFREMGVLDSYMPLYLPMAFAAQDFFVFMLFQFMWSVNDFLGPLIYISSVEKYPIALAKIVY